LHPSTALALRFDPLEICGVPSELLGRAESARGVQLIAYQAKLNTRIEYHVATDKPTFSYVLQAPVDAILSREGQPCEGRLNFFVPGANLALRGAGLMIGVICVFDPNFLAGLSEATNGATLSKFDLLTDIDSDRLIDLGRAMFREAVEPGFASSLFAEAVGMVSALEIARYDRARQAEDKIFHGGLAPWQMRRLEAYVRAHLSEELSLKGLGQMLSMSARHLCASRRASASTAGSPIFASLRRAGC
jgi:hypothetical protein